MSNSVIKIILVIALFKLCLSGNPIAVFHGLGDDCNNSGIKEIAQYLGEESGSYSSCVESGAGFWSVARSIIHQAEKACENIKKDKAYKDQEISVVGLSQGGLIARYIAEECDFGGSVKTIISIGSPQMGTADIPHCGEMDYCHILEKMTNSMVYTWMVQHTVGPAGYFRKYNDEKAYEKGSRFLALLNNEKKHDKSELYKERMLKVENLVLIMFEEDSMIAPKESAWFGFYDEFKDNLPMTETRLYKEDLIGLAKLNEQKKIHLYSCTGDHLDFDESDMDEYMIPFLK